MPEFIQPFGPFIMLDRVSESLLETVNRIGDVVLADEEKSKKWDWSRRLAGNVRRQVLVPFANQQEQDRVLDELKAKCTQYYNFLREKGAILDTKDVRPEDFEMKGLWLVSQYAGDFNPVHKHGGDFSSVVYLKVPETLKQEWSTGSHYPCGGLLEFVDGRPNQYVRTGYQLRPEPGLIALFPAWLMHTVYAFRAEGERRSMSFNVMLK